MPRTRTNGSKPAKVGTPWRSRIIGYSDEPVDQLLANPGNWRIHPKAQQEALAGVLREVGVVQNVLCNRTTGRMIDGHLRVTLAMRDNQPTVPVTWVELSEAEEALVLATLDPLSAMASADAQKLDELLRDVSSGEEAVQEMLAELARQSGLRYGEEEQARVTKEQARKTLAERFIVPPFSVLDARQGYWQERKRAWLALGIQSELGRGMENIGMAHPETTSTIDFYSQKRAIEAEVGHEITKDEAATVLADRGQLRDSRAANRARQQGGLLADQGTAVDGGASPWAGNRGPARASASPGGSPRPAASLGADGHTVRGDGRGRGPARSNGQDLMRGEHVVGQNDGHKMGFPHGPTVTQNPDGTLRYRGASRDQWLDASVGNTASGTSIFDPVLSELAYRWFCPPGGLVLDPFAGGSVRGIVASLVDRRYVGVDLRPEQVAANESQAQAITPDNLPRWIVGDSRNLAILQTEACDLIFTCPPYFDLEVYSDDPADLSNAGDYATFLATYRDIVAQSVALLRPDRFACVCVGDIRDKAGLYRNFVSDSIAAFQDAGARLYNEAILVTAVGSLPIRIGRQFSGGRKLGKTHQNVLVFVKGDPKRAATACGEVEVELPIVTEDQG